MTQKPPKEIDLFVKERDEALLSLDYNTIIAYAKKWGAKLPSYNNNETFWGGVHKARTALVSLPMPARIESKKWLSERGMQSLDDGDIKIP